ncbi:DUF3311 domain-containing protein [Priestia filamentosa]|uniref:Uncharacterized protein n=1 Tax=Priestia filamentosa TaxID=1402861 RepID=A0A1X7FK67_9BACI|nr:DUF3311 domain-containing protein [Priestia filamentosa]AKO91359.1 hypothetical protein BEH_04085 [Priestia filamentosa]MDT3765480.1 DUF3311 domain-containing protein [Priestia filamentosa]OXS67256.1 hypothetical protein B1B01_17340 [Priestia filamentosa]RJS65259.1 DUF3311 domain-containing protein [Priestia filamentosa]WCM16537.1 DUF3311 domain-containing protein [Priestia filamentosa]
MNKKFTIFLLSLIPFLGQFAFLPLVNRIHPIIFGLPLLHFWLFLWIILTPIITFIIYRVQKTEGDVE